MYNRLTTKVLDYRWPTAEGLNTKLAVRSSRGGSDWLTVGVVLLAQLGPGLAIRSVAALLGKAGQQCPKRVPLARQLEDLREEEQPEQQPATQAQPHRQRSRLKVELQGAGPDTQGHVRLIWLVHHEEAHRLVSCCLHLSPLNPVFYPSDLECIVHFLYNLSTPIGGTASLLDAAKHRHVLSCCKSWVIHFQSTQWKEVDIRSAVCP